MECVGHSRVEEGERGSAGKGGKGHHEEQHGGREDRYGSG